MSQWFLTNWFKVAIVFLLTVAVGSFSYGHIRSNGSNLANQQTVATSTVSASATTSVIEVLVNTNKKDPLITYQPHNISKGALTNVIPSQEPTVSVPAVATKEVSTDTSYNQFLFVKSISKNYDLLNIDFHQYYSRVLDCGTNVVCSKGYILSAIEILRTVKKNIQELQNTQYSLSIDDAAVFMNLQNAYENAYVTSNIYLSSANQITPELTAYDIREINLNMADFNTDMQEIYKYLVLQK